MNETSWNGIIVLDKPSGLPSNRVLGRIKHLLGLGGRRGPKSGFLGTLDPIATGVLPVFLGKSTKLIPIFEGLDKRYRVTVRLGQTTDTLDADGTLTGEKDLGGLTPGAARAAVLAFEGEMEQRVPSFSAVKINGQPAYKLARRGEEVPERVRRVTFRDLAVEPVALPALTFSVTCTAGGYVRSLARDIGERLGVGGHVTALRRLEIGGLFTLKNSYTLERIEERWSRGQAGFLFNPADFLPHHHPLEVDDASERNLRDGRTIPLAKTTPPLQPAAKVKALRSCGTLVAIGEVVKFPGGLLGFQPDKVLV